MFPCASRSSALFLQEGQCVGSDFSHSAASEDAAGKLPSLPSSGTLLMPRRPRGITVLSRVAFGAHASVYKAVFRGDRVAVKVLPVKDPETARELAGFQAVGHHPPHPNVVTTWEPMPSPRGSNMYLPMELCDNDLLSHVTTEGGLEEAEAVVLFHQILAGLGHLHRAGVYHLDVRPDNILLNDGVPKLADLGVSLVVPNSEGVDDALPSTQSTAPALTTRPCGPIAYASPEAIRAAGMRRLSRTSSQHTMRHVSHGRRCSVGSIPDGKSRSKLVDPHAYDAGKADAWSLGVTLFMCVTGCVPWAAATPGHRAYDEWVARHLDPALCGAVGTPSAFRTIFGVTHTQQGTPLSFELVDLLSGLLHPDPVKRLSVCEAQAHLFFTWGRRSMPTSTVTVAPLRPEAVRRSVAPAKLTSKPSVCMGSWEKLCAYAGL